MRRSVHVLRNSFAQRLTATVTTTAVRCCSTIVSTDAAPAASIVDNDDAHSVVTVTPIEPPSLAPTLSSPPPRALGKARARSTDDAAEAADAPPEPSAAADDATTTESANSHSVEASEEEMFLVLLRKTSKLSMTQVVTMTPAELLKVGTSYLHIHSTLGKMSSSRHRADRLRGRALRKSLRIDGNVRHLVFVRLQTSLDAGELTVDHAAELLSHKEWPEALVQAQNYFRRFVAAFVSRAVHYTQQNQATKREAAALAPPQQGDENDANLLLTPAKARWLLKKIASSFVRRTELLGPLATIGWQDIDQLQHPHDIVACMWAIHEARTHAPDSFWRQAIRRLATLRRTHGSDVISCTVTYRALRVCKRERWSGDVSTLTYLASEALKDILSNYAQSRQALDRPIPKGWSLREQDIEAQRRVRAVADLTPRRFMSLLVIAGELGHTFQAGFDQLADSVIAPAIRMLSANGDPLIVCEMLRLTRSSSVPAHQALIDLLVRINSIPLPTVVGAAATSSTSQPVAAVVLKPDTFAAVENAVRLVVRSHHLAQELHLGPFINLLLVISQEKRKLSPSLMLSFTENMYQIHRQLKKSSPMGLQLRKAADEFAFQLERMLKCGVVSVNVVNKFLEYSIMLDMSKQEDVYTNTATLRATRNRMFQECEAAGTEFTGVIVAHPLRRFVIDPYQAIFHASVQLGYYNEHVQRSVISNILQVAFQAGIFATIDATRVYQSLHYERPGGRQRLPTVRLADIVVREVIAACAQRATACGVGELAAVQGIRAEDLVARVSLALRLPEGTPLDASIVEMVLHATVFSPIRHLIAANATLRVFFEALTSSPVATDAQRRKVAHIFANSSTLPVVDVVDSATSTDVNASDDNASSEERSPHVVAASSASV